MIACSPTAVSHKAKRDCKSLKSLIQQFETRPLEREGEREREKERECGCVNVCACVACS